MTSHSPITEAFDEIADKYGSTRAQFTAPVAHRVVELADLIEGENVLDVGCGTGGVLLRAARAVAPGGHVTGIDLSSRMLARAAAEAEREGVARYVTLRPGDATRPHGPESFYTAVLSSLVLYLLPDPQTALAAWRKLLVPGGTLVFSWGTRQDPAWLPVFTEIEKRSDEPGFLSYTSRLPQPLGMESVLRKIGYRQISITTETLTTIYDSPQQFLDSSLTQGPWVSWRHIPQDRRQEAWDAAIKLMEPMRDSNGQLTRHTEIAYAKAHREAG
jgi:ubiquinone/menaquinone biosynthesis C-methylase UbiE